MFIEEDFEQHLVNLLNAARTATPQLEVKSVAVGDDEDITLENFHEYSKVHPAVVVTVADDEALRDLGQRGDSQFLSYQVGVYLFVKSKKAKGGIMQEARPILRQLKDILRGLRYTEADGATEGVGRLYYKRRGMVGLQNGVALILQEYELKTNDTNDTRRAL